MIPYPAAQTCACSPSRRGLLAGAMAAAPFAASPIAAIAAPTPSVEPARRHIIDVHRHIVAAGLKAVEQREHGYGPPFEGDTIEKMIADMDAGGVDKSIISLAAIRAVYKYSTDEYKALSRDANDTMARMRADHPGRFGIFGSIPAPDVDTDGALKEIAYCFDDLKADGVQFHTSYGDKWLGNPRFDPIFQELNRRGAVVYTHPLEAACCHANTPFIPSSIVEYAADTTRTIGNWMFSGAAKKYPNIKIIFSHSGGVLSAISQRFYFHEQLPENAGKLPEGGVKAALASFYYDTAQAYAPSTLIGMRDIAPYTHTLFGTDYPYRSAQLTYDGIRDSGAFNPAELKAVAGDNARRLLKL